MSKPSAGQCRIMRLLCDLPPGKGSTAFEQDTRRALGGLVRRGWVDWMEAAGIRIYRATDAGREAFSERVGVVCAPPTNRADRGEEEYDGLA